MATTTTTLSRQTTAFDSVYEDDVFHLRVLKHLGMSPSTRLDAAEARDFVPVTSHIYQLEQPGKRISSLSAKRT